MGERGVLSVIMPTGAQLDYRTKVSSFRAVQNDTKTNNEDKFWTR